MKIKYFLTSLVILLFSSCMDVLDVEPFGRNSMDMVFENEVTVGAYLNSCYQNFPRYGNHQSRFTNLGIAANGDSYEFMGAAAQSINRVYDGTVTSQINVFINSPGPGTQVQMDYRDIGYWDLIWRNIRRCNVFLSNIDEANVRSESLRQRWKAEAKVLRAYYYMDMIARFGPMPISEEPYPITYDTRELSRGSFEDCVRFIINDCEEAIDNEFLPWRITTNSEARRMTKAVAAIVKSRAILYLASDLWNGGQDYWEEAEQITSESLNQCLANGYALYSTVLNPSLFESAYHEYHCRPTDYSTSPVDTETILASRSTNGNLWVKENGLPIQNAFKAGLCPSQELVDAYAMKSNGLPILDLENPYQDEVTHLQPNYNSASGYDPENPYEGRDPRFYATVYYNGTQRKNTAGVMTPIEIYNGGNCGIQMNNNKRTQTGYYLRKYDHPNATTANLNAVHLTYRIFRLAELYLNYAEAANENGNMAGAVNAIQAIRERAEMPNINPVNKDEARLMIRNERRVELAFEENRYDDMRRWRKPHENLEKDWKYVSCMWIEKVGNEFEYHRGIAGDSFDPATGTWAGTGRERQCYTNKYLLQPLGIDEVNRLESVTGEIWQNPGW